MVRLLLILACIFSQSYDVYARQGAERIILKPSQITLYTPYSAPGVGFYGNILYRKTPLLDPSAGNTQYAGVNASGALASNTQPTLNITMASCTGIVAGQQVIDASTGTLIGVVSALSPCTGSGPAYTVSLTANNAVAVGATDNIMIQQTLPDTCNGTVAQRVRGNWGSTTQPTLYDQWNAFMNGAGNLAESQPGLWIDHDGNLRFNLNTATSNSNYFVPFIGPVAAPWIASAQDAWLNIIVSWNTCVSPTYAVWYWAVVGGPWTRVPFNPVNVGTNVFNANISSPKQGNNNIAFSFGGDNSNSVYGFATQYSDVEDGFMDVATSAMPRADVGLLGSAGVSGCPTPYNDGNPCIPTAVLNKYYNASEHTPVRINSTGNCSDWLGHQPTVCFTTDGGGAYAPSSSTFNSNKGYGGPFLASTPSTLWGSNPGPAAVPVSGPPSNSVYQKWITNLPSIKTTALTAVQSSYLGAHTYTAGDLLVVFASEVAAVVETSVLTCGTGWTPVWGGGNGNYLNGSLQQTAYTIVCYRIASGDSGDTGVSINSTDSTNYIRAMLMDYVGVDPANPIDSFGVINNVNQTTTYRMPNIVTSYANDLYVGLLAVGYATGWTFTPPVGTGLRSTINASSGAQLAVFDTSVPTPANFDPGAAYTTSSANFYMGISLALKPAGAVFAGQAHNTATFSGIVSGKFQVPAVASLTKAQCWGGGASGGGYNTTQTAGGSGGGFTQSNAPTLTGQTIYFSSGGDTPIAKNVQTGGYGAPSWINTSGTQAAPTTAANGCEAAGATVTLASSAGTPGCATGNVANCTGSGGVGSCSAPYCYPGGLGHNYSGSYGGSGGGGAGSGGAGGNASAPDTAGVGGTPDGGAGGLGPTTAAGPPGQIPGGGGAGGGSTALFPGPGLGGRASLTW